ncbi:cysteine hydrolase [Variovorax sp. ZT5P49]|uniref:cysteine hydrolase n=1 Tax=Variovorax sp. ZT5P49 TaxID=3443733 RepID=UPI003F44DF9C
MNKLSSIDIQQSVLLIMDYQPAVLGFIPDPGPLFAKVMPVQRLMRSRGGTVGFVRVAFDAADLEDFPAHSAMGVRVKAAGHNMHIDSPSTAVYAELGSMPGDIFVRKTRVGAFSTTDLDAQLRRAGIETVVLAGAHTSGVVLTTVREAHDLDYRVIVLSDACADPDVRVNEFLLKEVFPRQAVVTTAAEFCEALTP